MAQIFVAFSEKLNFMDIKWEVHGTWTPGSVGPVVYTNIPWALTLGVMIFA